MRRAANAVNKMRNPLWLPNRHNSASDHVGRVASAFREPRLSDIKVYDVRPGRRCSRPEKSKRELLVKLFCDLNIMQHAVLAT